MQRCPNWWLNRPGSEAGTRGLSPERRGIALQSRPRAGCIIDALEPARPFWDKLGAQGYDQYGNSALDWQGVASCLDGRPGAHPAEGALASAEPGGPGVHGVEVHEGAELSAEEAQALGLSPEAQIPQP